MGNHGVVQFNFLLSPHSTYSVQASTTIETLYWFTLVQTSGDIYALVCMV